MENQYASIAFDDFETQPALLENAGLTQGLPLSLILLTCFSSDIADTKGGVSAFIHSYFRWRVGHLAEENGRKLQEEGHPIHRSMGPTDWAMLCGGEKGANSPEQKQEGTRPGRNHHERQGHEAHRGGNAPRVHL